MLPALDWVVPAGHDVQLVLPAVAEKVPGTQGVHGALPVTEKVPGGQVEATQAVLPGGTLEPAGHSGQLVLPVLGCAVSAGHGEQMVLPAVAANVPAGHAGQLEFPERG